jgi:hypothetical protein
VQTGMKAHPVSTQTRSSACHVLHIISFEESVLILRRTLPILNGICDIHDAICCCNSDEFLITFFFRGVLKEK